MFWHSIFFDATQTKTIQENMQKQLSVLAVIVIAMSLSSVSFAQIEKGKFVVGGEIGYFKKFYPSSESSNSTGSVNKYSSSYRNFDTGINLGYMISERMEVGLYFNYNDYSNSSRSEDWRSVGSNRSMTQTLGFGPSFRYYQPIVEKIYIFGQLQSGFSKVKNEQSRAVVISIKILPIPILQSRHEILQPFQPA